MIGLAESLFMPLSIFMAWTGSFCVASRKARTRLYGFVLYGSANAIWIVYGLCKADSWIIIQFSVFMASTVYGILQNRGSSQGEAHV